MKTFRPADILLPQNIEFAKWSVVACDQYTSEPEYWEQVRAVTEGSPSAYHITFPEIYLQDGDAERRIRSINETMQFYLDSEYLRTVNNTLIYVKRDLGGGKIRRGIVGCVDLEDYEFKQGAKSLIRATEGTVLERIPPRVKIRENAPLELPHIMLLIDDQKKTVIEPLEKAEAMQELYHFDLMQNGGNLSGYQLSGAQVKQVISALETLADKEAFAHKYGVKNEGVLLFAVGDGNHSLATAKTCWENIKQTLSAEERKTHPARYALVEIVNIHDKSLEFEPIHRVVFDVEPEKMIDAFLQYYGKKASRRGNGGQRIRYIYRGKKGSLYVKDAPSALATGTLQMFLDDYIAENGGRIDYIHGDDVVEKLAVQEGNIGFLLPCMKKSELFPTVIHDGALPRKTFSMGEAREKRFYMEAKMIR